MTKDEFVQEISAVAYKLHREHGIPADRACVMTLEAVQRRYPNGPPVAGLGQDPTAILRQAADVEPIRKTREAISPWLWVLSVVSFGLAIMNTRRIARMFGDWKRKRVSA